MLRLGILFARAIMITQQAGAKYSFKKFFELRPDMKVEDKQLLALPREELSTAGSSAVAAHRVSHRSSRR